MKKLTQDDVYKKCDLSFMKFKTTDELVVCEEFIGQHRAVRALEFGLGITHRGYNIYVSGRSGVGKSSAVKSMLSQISKEKPKPCDWCYVYNFLDPSEPNTISLPTGMGQTLKKDMEDFVELLKDSIPQAFEKKEYEEEKQKITNELQREKNLLFDELQKYANQEEMQLQFAPTGIITIPMIGGKPITQEDYNRLDDEHKNIIRERTGLHE